MRLGQVHDDERSPMSHDARTHQFNRLQKTL